VKLVLLALVIIVAVALAIWRGIAVYKYAFHKKEL